MKDRARIDLFRQASKLLGDASGIENDPYMMPAHQGAQPRDDKPAYLDWATDVRRWYRFRPHTQDATIWRMNAQGLSAAKIGEILGFEHSWMSRRIRVLTGEIKAAEAKRAERPRTLAGLVAETEPGFLMQMLEEMHG